MLVNKPMKIERIGFEECMEMAVRGANVLQARSVEMAARYEIPLFM